MMIEKSDMRSEKRQRLSALFALTFILCFASGCAKMVTPVFDAGKHITIDVNFKGAIDTVNIDYYILFNANTTPKIPFDPTQFIEPGEVPQQPEIDYFTSYFNSWGQYMKLSGNTFFFAKPPFTSEAIATKEVVAILSGADPKRFSITFNMDKLAPYGDKIFFDVVTVDKSTKMVKDNLAQIVKGLSPYYVFTINDSVVSATDETAAISPESADIVDWRVLVN
jgi:hypothetical protein